MGESHSPFLCNKYAMGLMSVSKHAVANHLTQGEGLIDIFVSNSLIPFFNKVFMVWVKYWCLNFNNLTTKFPAEWLLQEYGTDREVGKSPAFKEKTDDLPG